LPSGDGGENPFLCFNPVNTGTAKRSRAVWLGHARKLIHLSAHLVSTSFTQLRTAVQVKIILIKLGDFHQALDGE
jgi:hypothetical protein